MYIKVYQYKKWLQSLTDAGEAEKDQMQQQLAATTEKLLNTQAELEKVTLERNEAEQKNKEFELYISRMRADCRETMNKVSCSIEWGNALRQSSSPEAENYMQDVVRDLRIIELEDKLKRMEQERKTCLTNAKMDFIRPSIIEQELETQKDLVKDYQLILEDGEKKLKDKLNNLRTIEIGKLHAQIRELKLRQEKFEHENENCSLQELKRMLEEGRQNLTNVVQRFAANDDKIEDLKALIEKQKLQINEMGNMLKYRENVTKVLKASRDQLMTEKQSLGRYSREVRTILVEVSTQSTKKDEKLKYLEQKIASRENRISQLETNLANKAEQLQIAMDKRYNLQDTITKQEKELQINCEQIAKLKSKLNKSTGNWSWGFLDSVYEVAQKDKPNKKIIKHYSNSSKDLHLDFSATNAQKSYSNNSYQVTKSSALLGHSLQTIDVVTTRLNFLNSVTEESLLAYDNLIDWDSDDFKSQFKKVFKLAAHRYEYTRNQARKSCQDFTNLLKFAITQSSGTQTK